MAECTTVTSETPVIPVVVLFATTASGKTALTKELFSKEGSHFILNAEIISADSQAVYRGMDVGTAKPDENLRALIPHHLIDILNPDEQFNVSDFVDAADAACHDIFSRGKIPVVCGGTGFYIRNFLYGVPKTPVSDEKIRNALKERIKKEGNEALYAELQKVDPQSAQKIHVNDAYRICRALEVFYLTGKTRTSYQVNQKFRSQYDFLFIVLQPERDVLYERIAQRTEKMFCDGLENEVRNLVKKGYTKETPGLKAIGYSEWFFFEDFFDLQEKTDFTKLDFERNKIKEEIIHHSRKYAKKQFTYIHDIPGSKIIKFAGTKEDYAEIAEIIKKFLKI